MCSGHVKAEPVSRETTWWNFKSGSYERYDDMTDEIAVQLIPQLIPAQMLYIVKRKQGHGVLDSMAAVLEVIRDVDAERR